MGGKICILRYLKSWTTGKPAGNFNPLAESIRGNNMDLVHLIFKPERQLNCSQIDSMLGIDCSGFSIKTNTSSASTDRW